jgi:tetratricopeptide (TPR) repeat protein
MPKSLVSPLRDLVRTPKQGLLAVLILGLFVLAVWLVGCKLWLRSQRNEADRAIDAYDFTEARRRLDRCLALRPNDTDLQLLAARTARRDGDLEAAKDHLYKAKIPGQLTSPQIEMERALIAAQSGQVKEVIDFLIESLEVRHPQSEQILESLAMGCVQIYQLERAMFWAHELQERWPKNAIGRLTRAQTTDTQGNRDEAIELLREVAMDYPRFYRARLALADMLFKSNRHREAIVEYGVLIQQRPDDLLPLLGLASCYERLGAAEQARPLMKQLEERFPDNSEVLLECGRFALNENHPDDAATMLQRAVELAPHDHEIHRELGICLGRLDRHEESRKHFEKFKQIEADLILLEKTLATMVNSPNDPKPRREAGEICLRNGQIAEGFRWLSGALDLAPKDGPTHQILANYYRSQGDTERASYHERIALIGR